MDHPTSSWWGTTVAFSCDGRATTGHSIVTCVQFPCQSGRCLQACLTKAEASEPAPLRSENRKQRGFVYEALRVRDQTISAPMGLGRKQNHGPFARWETLPR